MILKINRVWIGYCQKLLGRVGYWVPVRPWSPPNSRKNAFEINWKTNVKQRYQILQNYHRVWQIRDAETLTVNVWDPCQGLPPLPTINQCWYICQLTKGGHKTRCATSKFSCLCHLISMGFAGLFTPIFWYVPLGICPGSLSPVICWSGEVSLVWFVSEWELLCIDLITFWRSLQVGPL